MPNKAAFHQRIQSRHVIPAGALETSSVLVADGALSAVAWPIAISVLTMVPFLYYQQALKPKARTIKQIELDENLRPVDKKMRSAGKEAEARVKK
jgi:hypothetical protein